MDRDQRKHGWTLAALSADGQRSDPIVRIRPIQRIGDDPRMGQAGGAPVFAATSLTEASEEMLVRALAGGAAGLLLDESDGWEALERLSVRLTVTEARVGVPEGSISLLAMITGPRMILSRPALPPATGRLIGIGLDLRGFAAADQRERVVGPALTTARGWTLLLAAGAEVPAFERHTGIVATPLLAQSHADGFRWALICDQAPQA